MRLFEPVVDAAEHHVLDEYLTPAQREVAFTLREHVGERIPGVDRHQLAAQLVRGRMKREGEPNRFFDLVDETAQARQPTDRGDRGAAPRDPDIGQAARRFEYGVEVEHGLAHAHEDRVID